MVPRAFGFSVIFVFHRLFISLTRSRYLSSFSISFVSFYGLLERQNSRDNKFHLFCSSALGLVSGRNPMVRFITKSKKILCIWFSWTDSSLWLYHLSAALNVSLLHNFQSNIFPTKSCLLLYCFCASLMHSLTMRLTVSSPHNPHLLFFGLSSIFALA